jgi:hypothetical protein
MNNTVEKDAEVIRIQVAERLGWRSIEYSKDAYLIGYPTGRRVFTIIPSYARDIKAAWAVVDYLALHGIRTQVQIEPVADAGRSCCVNLLYHGRRLAHVQDRTIPLALCEAFLQIKGEELACSTMKAFMAKV